MLNWKNKDKGASKVFSATKKACTSLPETSHIEKGLLGWLPNVVAYVRLNSPHVYIKQRHGRKFRAQRIYRISDMT